MYYLDNTEDNQNQLFEMLGDPQITHSNPYYDEGKYIGVDFDDYSWEILPKNTLVFSSNFLTIERVRKIIQIFNILNIK